jgi:hypothetical protein
MHLPQHRLQRYQDAVLALSPQVKQPQTPEPRAPRRGWGGASVQPPPISISTATPSKSHAAPATPVTHAPRQEELAESPTAEPHGGPVFLQRPPTPGKDVLNGAELLQSDFQADGFRLPLHGVKGQKQKPPGYLGAGSYHSSHARQDHAVSGLHREQRNAGYMGGLPRGLEREGFLVPGLQAD